MLPLLVLNLLFLIWELLGTREFVFVTIWRSCVGVIAAEEEDMPGGVNWAVSGA